jgi:undecaprenyl-phosphate 4-deoxy-4-formamido-L-arabinose transferase
MSPRTKPQISVVIPVFNEVKSLPELLARCLAAMRATGRSFELVLVDDGSTDGSSALLAERASRERELVAVLLLRNFGQHAAILAGFERSRGDIVVTLDADLQNPPEEIPKLLAAMDAGYDVVGSVRVPREDGALRRVASNIVNRVVRQTTRVMMHDYGCMLRAYRRAVVDAMLRCPERSTFIPVLANSFARKTTEVEVSHNRRAAGSSKYSVWRLITLQFDMLTSMTTFPIRLLTVLGAVISALGMAFGAFLLVARLIFGSGWAAQGVFTLFAVLFFFVGAQFLALGLVGEYVGRIYVDVRGRPRYVVDRVVEANATDGSGTVAEGRDTFVGGAR